MAQVEKIVGLIEQQATTVTSIDVLKAELSKLSEQASRIGGMLDAYLDQYQEANGKSFNDELKTNKELSAKIMAAQEKGRQTVIDRQAQAKPPAQ